MVRFFNHRVAVSSIIQLLLEGGIYFLAILVAVALRGKDLKLFPADLLPSAFLFAGLMVAVTGALGLYRQNLVVGGVRGLAARAALTGVVGGPIAYFAFFLVPDGQAYREAFGFALMFALGGVVLIRAGWQFDSGSRFFTHRVLVLGTGLEALGVEQALSAAGCSVVSVVGFCPLKSSNEVAVSRDRILSGEEPLSELVRRLDVHEVIVAAREQRGGVMPLEQLLSCRLAGIRVTDLSGFFERVSGEVPVDSLKLSWLIYSNGFRQGWVRSLIKRTVDVAAVLLLMVVAAPIMLLTAVAILLETGRPIVFSQERVGLGGRTFRLLKFRSMRQDAESDGTPRWTANNDTRITPLGKFIRSARIDELPQLINVLKGDMSFVGPRPERPYFVDQLSKTLPFYSLRHSVKPGITGWAQVRYSYGSSVEDACRKLQYDLYYVKNHSLLLDIVILLETVRVVLLGEGAR